MPTLTIDGQEITVEPGTTIVQAAKRLGITIPVFCYHPGLSRPANCRMCLVNIAKWPKPQPGCYTVCADGMEVDTCGEAIKDVQRSVLEFILLNHPVDCPICDQAGECVLQEHYATYSLKPSRVFTQKVAKSKAKSLGPRVVLDTERCITCTRCVRFCEEVAGRPELIVEDRANTSEITTFPGRQLENAYSLNVVDICPVGALTDKHFRFRRRVWFLDKKDTVCTQCARGCSVRLDSFGNQTERVVPRYNPDVNNYWMCDEGRDLMRVQTRLEPPTLRHGANVGGDPIALVKQVATWFGDENMDVEDAPAVGIVVSASLSNEELWAWSKLAAALEVEIFLVGRNPWDGDEILKSADRDCNRTGAAQILPALVPDAGDTAIFLEAIEELDAIVMVGTDVALPAAALEQLADHGAVAVLGEATNPLAEAAAVVVPLAQLHQRDGTVTNDKGWVQRVGTPLKAPAGAITPLQAVAAMAEALGVDLGIDVTGPLDAVFAELASEVEAFKGMDYGYIGSHGAELSQGGPLKEKRAQDVGTPQWEPDTVHPTHTRPFALVRGT